MIYSFADEKAGRFTGRRVNCSERLIALNTPPGHIAVVGDHDRKTRRLNVEEFSGTDSMEAARWVVDFERPSEEIRAEQAAERDAQARMMIADAELKSLRALRQAMLQLMPEGEDKDRLLEIDADITAKRADIAVILDGSLSEQKP